VNGRSLKDFLASSLVAPNQKYNKAKIIGSHFSFASTTRTTVVTKELQILIHTTQNLNY
jgi:hypothetical protein